jgi:hypothetical protein
MALDAIRHQLQFLREDARGRARAGAVGGDLGERWAVAVANACARALTGARRAVPLADGLWDRLELDLAYVLTRHAFWLDAPALADVLADRIARGYRLERTVAESVARDATRLARAARPELTGHVAPTDQEFLRYVLVACALARDDEDLAQDLGLGRGFLARIQEALAGSFDAPLEDRTARYLPEIDAALAGIMLTLAAELKDDPWAMEAARVSYQMIGAGEPWRGWIARAGGAPLFDLLLRIGEAGSSGIAARELAAWCPALPAGAEDFAEVLVGRGLLDPRDYSMHASGKSGRGAFRLSPFALGLTAAAFAARAATTATADAVRGLDEAYQAAVIRRLPDTRRDVLHELARDDAAPLAPAGLSALLDRLEELLDRDGWRVLALARAQKAASPWVRRAAVRALAQRGEVASLVAVASGDESPVVREAALDGMLALGNG